MRTGRRAWSARRRQRRWPESSNSTQPQRPDQHSGRTEVPGVVPRIRADRQSRTGAIVEARASVGCAIEACAIGACGDATVGAPGGVCATGTPHPPQNLPPVSCAPHSVQYILLPLNECQPWRTTRCRSPKRTVEFPGTTVGTPGTQANGTPAVMTVTPLVECLSTTSTPAGPASRRR